MKRFIISMAIVSLVCLGRGDAGEDRNTGGDRAGTVNLLTNSRFEFRAGVDNTPLGWDLESEKATCRVDTEVTHNGTPSLRIEVSGTGERKWHLVRKSVQGIRAQTPYTVSGWVKTEGLSAGSLAYISLNCFSERVGRLAANDSPTKLSGTSDWKRIVFAIPELPKGTQTARFSLCLYGFGKAWFTELQVEEGTYVSPYRPNPADERDRQRIFTQRRDAERWGAGKGISLDQKKIRPRVAILDLGLPDQKSECGFPSRPDVFESLLKSRCDTARLSGDEISNSFILNPRVFDLLIVPTGSWFPRKAVDSLLSFLSEGGQLLTCGGYAFDTPVEHLETGWSPLRSLPKTFLMGTDPVTLPPAANWHSHCLPGYKTEIRDVEGVNGERGIEVSTRNLQAYNTGTIPFPKVANGDWSVISFWAKGSKNTRKVWFELDEDDGSRWHYAAELTDAWKAYSLVPSDFVYWTDNPSIGRGASGDRIRFARVNGLIFGVAIDIVESGCEHAVSLSDIRVGQDPLRATREIAVPQINTRTALIRDAIHPRPEQIGIYDPSFPLREVATTSLSPEMAGILPDVFVAGSLSGLSAIAQLGVNGHGFGPNRACWRPLLACADNAGRPRGHAAAIVHHFAGTFAGSSWAIFGVDNRDLFTSDSPVAQKLLLPVVETLLRRLYLNNTTAEFASYRAGETAKLKTFVSNFSSSPQRTIVRFRLTDESHREVARFSQTIEVAAGKSEPAVSEWLVPADSPDFLYLTAELERDGKTIDRENGAFVVWNPDVIARGPRLQRDGLHLTIDGEARFFMGCQTFWGQHASVTARSPLHFYRDFQMMREYGLRWTRCFLTFHNEAEKRVSDAVVQLAQKFGIVLYHTPNLPNTADPAELEKQNQTISEIASRYREVPGLAIDICNEPVLKMGGEAFKAACGELPAGDGSWRDPSVRKRYETATALQRRWAATNCESVHKIKPSIPVAVGWSQGWAGGEATKDPQVASLDLDFTDRHYYGNPVKMPQEIKDLDLRALGKPMIVGECGAKNHPTFQTSDPWGMGDDDESYDRRFRYLVSHAFGLGATALLSWHWRDPMEGIFPCGLVHSTWVPRPTASLYKKMAATFGKLQLAENPPDTVILMGDYLRFTNERGKSIQAAHAADDILVWYGVNYSKLTDSMLDSIPESVKLIVYPAAYVLTENQVQSLERFVSRGGTLLLSGNPIWNAADGKPRTDWLSRLCGVHAKNSTPRQPFASDLASGGNSHPDMGIALDDAEPLLSENNRFFAASRKLGKGSVLYSCVLLEAQGKEKLESLRDLYGKALKAAGVALTRIASEPESLEVFRVPGKGATGWVFWNGGNIPVSTGRGGHAIQIPPQRVGYLQIANDGILQIRETL